MKYDELVKALRCDFCTAVEDDCKMWYCNEVEPNVWQECCRAKDAAAAIEELSKTVEDLTTKVECTPMQISEKAFDRAIDAWNERARKVVQDGPIITPCRGCSDYDGYGGCKSKGGCARAKMEVQE